MLSNASRTLMIIRAQTQKYWSFSCLETETRRRRSKHALPSQRCDRRLNHLSSGGLPPIVCEYTLQYGSCIRAALFYLESPLATIGMHCAYCWTSISRAPLMTWRSISGPNRRESIEAPALRQRPRRPAECLTVVENTGPSSYIRAVRLAERRFSPSPVGLSVLDRPQNNSMRLPFAGRENSRETPHRSIDRRHPSLLQIQDIP